MGGANQPSDGQPGGRSVFLSYCCAGVGLAIPVLWFALIALLKISPGSRGSPVRVASAAAAIIGAAAAVMGPVFGIAAVRRSPLTRQSGAGIALAVSVICGLIALLLNWMLFLGSLWVQ